MFNAVGALYEFQAKHRTVQVAFDELPAELDEDGKKIFRIKCTLNGRLDEETTEPLSGIGAALKKQNARVKAADVIAQILVKKGYLHPDTLKVVEDANSGAQRPPTEEPSIAFAPVDYRSDIGDLITSDALCVKKEPAEEWGTPVADWSDPLENGNFVLEPHVDLPQTKEKDLIKPVAQAVIPANETCQEKNSFQVNGSLEQLRNKLKGTGLVINILPVNNNNSEENSGEKHTCVLLIKPEKSDPFEVNNNQFILG